MSHLKESLDLEDAYRKINPTEKKFTWKAKPTRPEEGQETRIDTWLVSRNITTKNCYIKTFKKTWSKDHAPVVVEIECPNKDQRPTEEELEEMKRNKKRPRFKDRGKSVLELKEKLKDIDTKQFEETTTKVNKALDEDPPITQEEIDNIYDDFIGKIQEEIKTRLGTTEGQDQSRPNKDKKVSYWQAIKDRLKRIKKLCNRQINEDIIGKIEA